MTTMTCQTCGAEMTGRADRKFCSAACRQKQFRIRNVTERADAPSDAPAYRIADGWASLNDEFWSTLGGLSLMDRPPASTSEDADYYGDGQPFEVAVGVLGNASRKHPRPEDIPRNRERLQEFLDDYGSHRAMLDRMHATARELLAREPYAE